MSEVGFEPTPTYVDQNAQYYLCSGKCTLESGTLDHSAILTVGKLLVKKLTRQKV